MTNLVKFGTYKPETARKERKQLESGNQAFMKLGVGKNICRLLPPPEGVESPFKIVQQHYLQIPGSDRPFVFTCPASIAGAGRRKCPACEQGHTMRSSGNAKDRAMAYSSGMLPSIRIFANVIDRTDPDSGPKVLAFGKMVMNQINDIIGGTGGDDDDEDFEPLDLFDPLEGYDIAIIRKGSGKTDTEYKVKAASKPRPLHPEVEVMNAWILGQKNLDELSKLPTDEAVHLALDGVHPDEATTRQPSRRELVANTTAAKSSKKTKKADVVDAEFDEVSEDDFDMSDDAFSDA